MMLGKVPELVLMNLGNFYFKWKIHFVNSLEILDKLILHRKIYEDMMFHLFKFQTFFLFFYPKFCSKFCDTFSFEFVVFNMSLLLFLETERDRKLDEVLK